MMRWRGIVLLIAVAVPWWLWWRTYSELRSLRAAPALGTTVREVVREIRPGETRVVTVPLPGGSGPAQARVELVTVPVPVHGTNRVVEVPRVVTVTPPVPCRTEEECRRLFGAAPQSISIRAHLRRGTVVPVHVTVNGEEQEVHAPLSRDFPMEIQLVSTEPGVWHALQPETERLQVTEVRTETTLQPPQQADPARPADHLRAVFSVAADGLRAGLEYENWWGSGRYRVQVGLQAGATGGWYATASYVLPLR